jgi:uncharacterized peroxidase-related enzyme
MLVLRNNHHTNQSLQEMTMSQATQKVQNGTDFEVYTAQNAPEGSKPALRQLEESVGLIPNLAAAMAGSPSLINGFIALRGIIQENSSFTTGELELIFLTNAAANECNYCQSIHSMFAQKAGISDEVINAVRSEKPLVDSRRDALVKFARSVVKNKGRITSDDLQNFLSAGFEKKHVLDIVACLSQSVMANYTNHIAKVKLDEFLKG